MVLADTFFSILILAMMGLITSLSTPSLIKEIVRLSTEYSDQPLDFSIPTNAIRQLSQSLAGTMAVVMAVMYILIAICGFTVLIFDLVVGFMATDQRGARFDAHWVANLPQPATPAAPSQAGVAPGQAGVAPGQESQANQVNQTWQPNQPGQMGYYPNPQPSSNAQPGYPIFGTVDYQNSAVPPFADYGNPNYPNTGFAQNTTRSDESHSTPDGSQPQSSSNGSQPQSSSNGSPAQENSDGSQSQATSDESQPYTTPSDQPDNQQN